MPTTNSWFSPDQAAVVTSLLQWIRIPSSYIIVGGYAGTGKTTIAAALRKILAINNKKLTVSFACFTGKSKPGTQKQTAGATRSIKEKF